LVETVEHDLRERAYLSAEALRLKLYIPILIWITFAYSSAPFRSVRR
jgi:hypothetical protein